MGAASDPHKDLKLLRLPRQELHGFVRHAKKMFPIFFQKARKVIPKDFYQLVRPNSGDGKLRAYAEDKVVAYKKNHPGFHFKLTQDWITANGTIALFICPNCGHITHADAQAAFNIAVRGYIKDSVPSNLRDAKGKHKPGTMRREYYTQRQAALIYSPVEMPAPL